MAHHDVFISYSTLDKPISDAVCAALEGHGIRCWVAPRDITPGQDWSDAIIDAFADCRVCLLILSTASNQSDQVKREFQNAVSEAKPILPFRPAVPTCRSESRTSPCPSTCATSSARRTGWTP